MALKGVKGKGKKVDKGKGKSSFVDTRFKFKSVAARINDVVSNTSFARPAFVRDDGDDEWEDGHDPATAPSLFAQALAAAALSNLSAPFQRLHEQVAGRSKNLPLLVHHRTEVVGCLCDALHPSPADDPDDLLEGPSTAPSKAGRLEEAERQRDDKRKRLRAKEQLELAAPSILGLLPPLVDDLSSVLLQPSDDGERGRSDFHRILQSLLVFASTRELDPSLLERAFQVVAHLFKVGAKDLLASQDQLEQAWRIVRLGLGAPLKGTINDREPSPVSVDDAERIADDEEPSDAVETSGDADDDLDLPSADELDAQGDQGEQSLGKLVHSASPSAHASWPKLSGKTTLAQRRLLASAFGLVLRRAASSGGDQDFLRLVFDDLVQVEAAEKAARGDLAPRRTPDLDRKGKRAAHFQGEEDGSSLVMAEGVAWLLSEACKSVDHRLHSRAPAVVVAVTLEPSRCGLSSPVAAATVRAAMIAIVQHARANTLEDSLAALLAMAAGSAARDAEAIAASLTVVLSVGNGSCIAPRLRPDVYSLVSTLATSGNVAPPKRSMLVLAGLCSTADCDDPTTRDLDQVVFTAFERPTSIKIVEALIRQRHVIPAPRLARLLSRLVATLNQCVSDRPSPGGREAALVLRACSEQGCLQGVDWLAPESTLRTHVESCLAHLDQALQQDRWLDLAPEVVAECLDWLDLLGSTPATASTSPISTQVDLLLGIVDSDRFTASSMLASFSAHPFNWPVLISSMLRGLAGVPAACARVLERLPRLLRALAWHSPSLAAVADIVQVDRDAGAGLSEDDIKSTLLPALISHDTQLRTAATRLLSATARPNTPLADVVAQCSRAEQTELSVAGARERGMHIRKLGKVVAALPREGSGLAVDVAIASLIAQLKVPMRPVWDVTIDVLSEVALAFPSHLWNLVWDQIQSASSGALADPTTYDPAWDAVGTSETVPDVVVGTSFRCSTLTRLGNELERDSFAERLVELAGEQRHGNLDVLAFEGQCLALLQRVPRLAQQHNGVVVDLFLSLCRPTGGELLGGATRSRLPPWLALFARFTNPKALRRTDELRRRFEALLADPDPALRRSALECIFTWGEPGLGPFIEDLRNLLEPPTSRDALSSLSGSLRDRGPGSPRREPLSAIFIRLLFGNILELQRRSSTSAVHRGRKTSLLNALTSCTSDELRLLVELMTEPLRAGEALSAETETRRQLGFLDLLGDVIKHLAPQTVHAWPTLLDAALSQAGALVGREDAGAKRVRGLCVKRLLDFYTAPVDFDFSAWETTILTHVVEPRLDRFAGENAQSTSPLLALFAAWSASDDTMHLLTSRQPAILTAVFGILVVPNAKAPVLAKVLDVVDALLDPARTETPLGWSQAGLPGLSTLVQGLEHRMRLDASTGATSQLFSCRLYDTVAALAPHVKERAAAFCDLMVTMLDRRRWQGHETPASKLLLAVVQLWPQCAAPPTSRARQILPRLFEHLDTPAARTVLVRAFAKITEDDVEVAGLRDLLVDLNSFSSRRVEEPDFDRRLAAFARADGVLESAPVATWAPLVHHCLFQIRDESELSLRSSATRFIVQAHQVASGRAPTEARQLVMDVTLPGIRRALRSRSEIVREEAVLILESLVERPVGVMDLEQMRDLLVEGDREGSFFANVYHVQAHRRTRAFRRLAKFVGDADPSPRVILDYCCPLLLPVILHPTTSTPPEVVSEAVAATGRLASRLPWPGFQAMLRPLLRVLERPEKATKPVIRAFNSVFEAFHFDLQSDSEGSVSSHRIRSTVEASLVPRILRFSSDRHGAEETLRILATEGVGHLVRHLPEPSRQRFLAETTASLAQVSKSLQQDVRIQARGALAKIAATLPAQDLPGLIAKARSVLTRGPQVHVLAHLLHAIVARVAAETSDAFDEAAPAIMDVVEGDLFGSAARERESTELRAKSKYAEVRTSRSFDTLQIVSRRVHIWSVRHVLAPFKAAAQSRRTVKSLRAAEEGLRYVGAGLLASELVTPAEIVALVHALLAERSTPHPGSDDAPLTRVAPLAAFGLDLLANASRKSKFRTDDLDIVGRLDPLVSLVGDALYVKDTDVMSRALRAMAELIKLPLPAVETSATVIARRMLAISVQLGSSDSEVAQSAVRTLAGVIRTGKAIVLTESQLGSLLDLVEPDLEHPDRQLTLFALLRALLARQMIAPRLYSVMASVERIAITSPSAQAREIARSAFLQFLIGYPQGKGRMGGFVDFLLANLGYPVEGGRASALELLAAICNKLSAAVVADHADAIFSALVLALANEASPRCSEMAVEVFGILVGRPDLALADHFGEPLLSWLDPKCPSSLREAALQLLEILVRRTSPDDNGAHRSKVYTKVCGQLDARDMDQRLQYRRLVLLGAAHEADPSLLLAGASPKWSSIRESLLSPDSQVRSAAARLVGSTFARLQEPGPSQGDDHPLSTVSLLEVASQTRQQIEDAPLLDDDLALQAVKNLVFALRSLQGRKDPVGMGSEQEDDSDDGFDGGAGPVSSNGVPGIVRALSRTAIRAVQARPSVYADDTGTWARTPTAVLRCFAAVIDTFRESDSDGVLLDLLRLLHRVGEDPDTGNAHLERLKALASECVDLARAKVDSNKFASAWSRIQADASTKRQRRKDVAAQRALTDPELDASRRASRGEAKARHKKRKQAAFATARALNDGHVRRKKARPSPSG